MCLTPDSDCVDLDEPIGSSATMALEAYEPLLQTCAETGHIDYSAWPSILPPLVEQLSHIAHCDFDVPRPYPTINPVLPSQRPLDPDRFIENPPILPSNTPSTPRTLPPVPPFPGSSISRVSDSQPKEEEHGDKSVVKEQLPAEVLQLLDQSLKTLRTCFAQQPPHTIQRLSELVLYPKKNYRTLPAWLRALDRVVSVSSGAEIFPLSDVPPNIGNGIINGTDIGGILFVNSSNETRNGYDRDSLGSDESLGGALLTPIPWLKDSDFGSGTDSSTLDPSSKVETWQDQSSEEDMLPIPEDNIAATVDAAQAIAAVAQEHIDEGLIPEREDGAVTQGELIRLEQEAGVVPVPHEELLPLGDADIELDDDGDVVPHARGPDLVGTVDMGKVGGQERQIHISSPPNETTNSVESNDAQETLLRGGSAASDQEIGQLPIGHDFIQIEKDDVKSKAGSSDDGDIVLVDADGVTDRPEQNISSRQN